jgi:hypothetical protein
MLISSDNLPDRIQGFKENETSPLHGRCSQDSSPATENLSGTAATTGDFFGFVELACACIRDFQVVRRLLNDSASLNREGELHARQSFQSCHRIPA